MTIRFNSDPAPDAVGHFYVSMVKGERVALLAGPFPTHEEAKAQVTSALNAACEIDGFNWFNVFGTCSLPLDFANPPAGKLNARLGVTCN